MILARTVIETTVGMLKETVFLAILGYLAELQRKVGSNCFLPKPFLRIKFAMNNLE